MLKINCPEDAAKTAIVKDFVNSMMPKTPVKKHSAVIYARVSSTGERQDATGAGLEVVEDLTAAGVNVYFQDHRMNTLKEDGTPDPITKMTISMLGSFAEMEREQIAYRLNSGGSPTTAYKVKKAMKLA